MGDRRVFEKRRAIIILRGREVRKVLLGFNETLKIFTWQSRASRETFTLILKTVVLFLLLVAIVASTQWESEPIFGGETRALLLFIIIPLEFCEWNIVQFFCTVGPLLQWNPRRSELHA